MAAERQFRRKCQDNHDSRYQILIPICGERGGCQQGLEPKEKRM